MTFWDKAEFFPPVCIRLLARKFPSGPPLSNQDISKLSGLTIFEVAHLSQQVDWTGVDVPTMRRYVTACNLDLENADAVHRARTYLRGKTKKGTWVPPRFSDIQRSPIWVSELQPCAIIFFRHASNPRTRS